jgi:hypothetical protein
MHIPDLTPLNSGKVAVGWLDRDHPFLQGEVAPEFVARLKAFALRYGESMRALGLGGMGGCHTCQFCGTAVGFGSFGVPCGTQLYSAPDMIAHYVEQHRYAPPAEFIAAVLACPLPGTPEYIEAVQPFVDRNAFPRTSSSRGPHSRLP